MRSLSDGPAGRSEPSARPLPAATGVLWHREVATLVGDCPRADQPSASHRFRAEARHLRVSARPKGPFYCRESALLGLSGEAKTLHLDHFRGRQQGRISALNCSMGRQPVLAGSQPSLLGRHEMNSLRQGSYMIHTTRPTDRRSREIAWIWAGSPRNLELVSDHIGSHTRAAGSALVGKSPGDFGLRFVGILSARHSSSFGMAATIAA